MSAARIARGLLHLAREGANWCFGWIARAVSLFETRSGVTRCVAGSDAPERLGARVVVFCHFDRAGRIRPHTRAYLDALVAEGLDLVFVTNSGRLAPTDLAWLMDRAARIVLRRNLGYDFAAWRDGLAVCRLPDPQTALLLIANDSVYGPLRPLGPLLRQIDFAAADVWSITDSWQHRFHLQSYFVAFGPAALQDPAFARFWRSVRNVRSKWWVVMRYEVGLSRALMHAGLRCRALWPYTDAIASLQQTPMGPHAEVPNGTGTISRDHNLPRPASTYTDDPAALAPLAAATRDNTLRVLRSSVRRTPLNPTADLWQVLIRQGCPFLKRELLRDNPGRVLDVAAWPDVVAEVSNEARTLILRDLELSLKNLSP